MGESDLLSSGNSAGILKLTQPAQKGPFLPHSTSLPSPDVLRAKRALPDHLLIGVHYVVHVLEGHTAFGGQFCLVFPGSSETVEEFTRPEQGTSCRTLLLVSGGSGEVTLGQVPSLLCSETKQTA